MDKTHRIGLRTTHGRSFFRFGTQIAPKGVTQLEVTPAELKALELECAREGSVLEIAEKAEPIKRSTKDDKAKDDKASK